MRCDDKNDRKKLRSFISIVVSLKEVWLRFLNFFLKSLLRKDIKRINNYNDNDNTNNNDKSKTSNENNDDNGNSKY